MVNLGEYKEYRRANYIDIGKEYSMDDLIDYFENK